MVPGRDRESAKGMGRVMRAAPFVLALSAALAAAQPPSGDATRVSLSDATLLTTIDAGKLKGEPTQVGWSPDGSQLYLQVSQRGADGLFGKSHFFVLSAVSPQPSPVDGAPAWADEYWKSKSGKTGPGMNGPEIELTTEEKAASDTQSAMGGSTYGGGGVDAVSGTTIESARRRSEQSQRQRVVTLSLRGRTIGRFVNQPLMPGYTFGWSPQPFGLIAYADEAGRLVVMDMRGNHQDLASSKNVVLPAWSPDSKKIAYLQKASRNRWDFYIVSVEPGGR
jgi:hypothetical protein